MNIDGPLRMISRGNADSDSVKINLSGILADSICMEGPAEVSVGGVSAIAVNGSIKLLSHGASLKSAAWIKSGTAITAGSIDLDGHRTVLDPYSFLYMDGNFHMEASDKDKCSVRGLYRASSVSGNCLE
jgi:hypothetical protein